MRTGRSRSWAAWAISALVHALVAVLVLRAGERAALRAPTEREIVEVDVDVAVGGPSPSPSPRQAGRGDEKEASPSRRSPSQPSGTQPSPSQPSPSSTAPSNEGAGAGAPIDLSFGVLPDEVKGRFAAPPAPEETLRARPGRFAVDELRVEVERRQDAVANVAAGRVDPLLYDYLRGARSRFEQDAERLANDLAVGAGDMVRDWGRGYVRTVEDVNRGVIGARVDAPREGGGDTRNEKSPGADVFGAYGETRRQAEAGAEERRAEICLDVAAGRETAVALRRGSGNAALDRLTLESFAKAIAARPVPADARRGLACYELLISAYRMPPLPFVSCGVGRAGLTCVWPFKKVASVKGRLLSVEYPPADRNGGSERAGPSLVRKPR